MESDWKDLLRRFRSGSASTLELHRHAEKLRDDLVAMELIFPILATGTALAPKFDRLKSIVDGIVDTVEQNLWEKGGGTVPSMKKCLVRSYKMCLGIFNNKGRGIGWETEVIKKVESFIGAYDDLVLELSSTSRDQDDVGDLIGWHRLQLVGFAEAEEKIVNMLLLPTPYNSIICGRGSGGGDRNVSLAERVIHNNRIRERFDVRIAVGPFGPTAAKLSAFTPDEQGLLPEYIWEQDEIHNRSIQIFEKLFKLNHRRLVVLADVWAAGLINPIRLALERSGGTVSLLYITTETRSLLSQLDCVLLWRISPDQHIGRTIAFPLIDTWVLSIPQCVCLLYLTCLTKHVAIDAEKLMCLWIAEHIGRSGGILDAAREEEMAERVLEELIRLGMCRAEEKFGYDGGSVVMVHPAHTIQQEAYIPLAEEANFFNTHGLEYSSSNLGDARRLALNWSSAMGYVSQNFPTSKLTTFFGFGLYLDGNCKSLLSTKRLYLLRVLDLENTRLDSLPEEIGNMIHLKYLGLRRTLLKSIPSSVGNLHNLLTLDIRVTFIVELPPNFWKIDTLRHIFLDHTVKIESISSPLKNLQTVKALSSQEWTSNSLILHMTNLRKLAIKLIKEQHHTAIAESLGKLPFLRDLYLAGDSISKDMLATINQVSRLRVLSLWGKHSNAVLSIEPQLLENLREFNLYCSRLQQDPFPLLGKLSHLRCLRLHNAYVGEQALFSAGGFPLLERLYLASLPIKQWVVEQDAMPRLKHITIKACKELYELPGGLQSMARLESLELLSMPDSFKEKVQKEGNWGKIKHIPIIKIDHENIK